MSVASVRVSAGGEAASEAGSRTSAAESGLAVRVGLWRGRVNALSHPMAARPPGVRIGRSCMTSTWVRS